MLNFLGPNLVLAYLLFLGFFFYSLNLPSSFEGGS
jgi:hypothetical protein